MVLQKTEFDFVPLVLRTKPFNVELLFEQEVSVLLQFHKFLEVWEKDVDNLQIRIQEMYENLICWCFPQFLLHGKKLLIIRKSAD